MMIDVVISNLLVQSPFPALIFVLLCVEWVTDPRSSFILLKILNSDCNNYCASSITTSLRPWLTLWLQKHPSQLPHFIPTRWRNRSICSCTFEFISQLTRKGRLSCDRYLVQEGSGGGQEVRQCMLDTILWDYLLTFICTGYRCGFIREGKVHQAPRGEPVHSGRQIPLLLSEWNREWCWVSQGSHSSTKRPTRSWCVKQLLVTQLEHWRLRFGLCWCPKERWYRWRDHCHHSRRFTAKLWKESNHTNYITLQGKRICLLVLVASKWRFDVAKPSSRLNTQYPTYICNLYDWTGIKMDSRTRFAPGVGGWNREVLIAWCRWNRRNGTKGNRQVQFDLWNYWFFKWILR